MWILAFHKLLKFALTLQLSLSPIRHQATDLNVPSLTMTVALQIFRVLAACTSATMLLSPTPMIYKIYKNRDTGVMSIIPLATMLVNAHLWYVVCSCCTLLLLLRFNGLLACAQDDVRLP